MPAVLTIQLSPLAVVLISRVIAMECGQEIQTAPATVAMCQISLREKAIAEVGVMQFTWIAIKIGINNTNVATLIVPLPSTSSLWCYDISVN